jgi:phage/plasmid primase-like uncharacterized protein
VTELDDHSLLVYCHFGCTIDAIMEAVDLEVGNLFPSAFAVRFGNPTGRRGLAQRRTAGQLDGMEGVLDREKFEAMLALAREGAGPAVEELARTLGLPVETLDCLRVGFFDGRWVFPERDDQERLVGLLFRRRDGYKVCAPDSIRGLTIPVDAPMPAGPLYLAEGATDTAALLACGAAAIGRPSARASCTVQSWLTRMLRRYEAREIIVVGDRDCDLNGLTTGLDGARDLARFLRAELNRPVSWALPYHRYEDVREQVVAGDWSRGLVVEEAR